MRVKNYPFYIIFFLTVGALPRLNTAEEESCYLFNAPELQYLPHPYDCTKAFKCNEASLIDVECPEGLWYNPNIQVCDFPENSGCIVEKTCPVGVLDYFPDPYSCTSFYECNDGNVFRRSCPSGAWFNQYGKKCFSTYSTNANNVCSDAIGDEVSYLPVPGDCSVYYKCIGETAEPKILKCPAGMYFDKNSAKCSDIKPLTC